MMNVFFNT